MVMDEFQEYLNKLQKRGSKPHKIRHCLGSRDAFHWVRKNKYKALEGTPCDKLLYSKIVSEVNKALVEMLLEGHQIDFPHKMGYLILTSSPARVAYKDGELKTNYMTDWKKTLQYMYENPDSHKRIMRVQPLIYAIRYYKTGSPYHNRHFYTFRLNRSLAKKLGAAVEAGKLNTEVVDEKENFRIKTRETQYG